MRLLAGYRFHFRDLGLERDEARFGRVKIRRKILGMVDAISAAQPRTARILLLTAGRLLVNTIAIEPPRRWGYGIAGNTLEFGINFLPWETNRSFLRLHAALRVDGLGTLAAPGSSAVSLSALGGFEFELPGGAILQPSFGVRGGHRFAFNDHFHARSCTPERARGDGRRCSQWLTNAYVAAVILERVRVQLGLDWFPERQGFDNRRFRIEFGLGMQFF